MEVGDPRFEKIFSRRDNGISHKEKSLFREPPVIFTESETFDHKSIEKSVSVIGTQILGVRM